MSIKIFKILIVSFLILFVVNIDSQAVGQQRGSQSGFTVTHGPDFDRPLVPTESGYDFPKVLDPKGYQSTATIEAKFYKNGVVQTITEPVTWTIEDIQNSAPSWNRASNAKNGLVWGDTVNPYNSFNYKWKNDLVGGTVPNGATVKLTDVVGQRTVTLKAETTIGGVTYSDTAVVTFGKGPLSVFSKAPSSGGRKWATALGLKATKGDIIFNSPLGDFTEASTSFPAADFCGGTVHTGASDITVGGSGPDSYTADFTKGKNLNHWKSGDTGTDTGTDTDTDTTEYYSTTSKLPTLGQLLAVSGYEGAYADISNVKRKGAALAAGWPYSGSGDRYWSGQVYFRSNGVFLAGNVYLADGNDIGINYVTNATPVVACVP